MTTVSYPGVYVEEIPGGARPIEAAGTSTAAFVGEAEKGPDDIAVRITSWDEYQKQFGSFSPPNFWLAQSVYAFFNNGGRQCYIVRVTRSDAVKADVTIKNRAGVNDGVKFTAKNKGAWGNYIFFSIEDGSNDPGNEFKLTIRRQTDPAVIPENYADLTPLEVHDNLSMDPDAPNYVVKVLTRDSAILDADVLEANISLQRGFHRSGPDPKLATVAKDEFHITDKKNFQINLDGDGFQEVTLRPESRVHRSGPNPDFPTDTENKFQISLDGDGFQEIILEASTNTTTLNDVANDIQLKVSKLFTNFTCAVQNDDKGQPCLVLTSGTNSNRSLVQIQSALDNDAAGRLKLGLAHGGSSFQLTLNDVARDIQAKVSKLTPKKTSTPVKAFEEFTCTVENDAQGRPRLLLRSGTPESTEQLKNSAVQIQNSPSNNAAESLHLGLGNGGTGQNALAVRRPAIPKGTPPVIQLGDAAVTGVVTKKPTAGYDGKIAVTAEDFKDAFSRLNNKSDVSLLAVPGVGTTTMLDYGMAYCQNRPLQDVFYIGEMYQYDNQPDDAESFRKKLTKANSYGAVYFPWVMAPDPAGRSLSPEPLPPSGFVAGLYARIDSSRGVWKAPAGIEASLNGVVGLAAELTDTEQGILNPINVNVIRRFSLAGVVSWGARTITADPEYKYIPVRRTAIMLRRSIYDGIQWAVFEPNDERLWSALRLNIGSFMNSLFRAGAFQGSKSSDAYFVRCGLGDTMVQDDIDRGQVIVLVGFAPLKPAEFIIVRIQQKAGQQ